MLALFLALAALTATPAQLPAVLKAAQPGDTIKLERADFGTVKIAKRTFQPAVVIDAARARLGAVVIDRSSGVTWRGGIVGGAAPYAFSIKASSRIGVESITATDAVRGIVIDNSTDIVVNGNLLTGLRTDGIDIVGQRITVTNNICRDFSPIPADHPDCIQGWSDETPTADVTVTGNSATGTMQAVFFRSDTPGALGFDRIRIERNVGRITYGNGFTVLGGRDSLIRWNDGASIDGGKVMVRMTGTGTACGNVLAELTKSEATRPC